MFVFMYHMYLGFSYGIGISIVMILDRISYLGFDDWLWWFTFQVNHVLEVLMFWIWFWLWGCTCRFVCTWPRLVFRVPMYIRIHARGFMFVGACLYIYRCIYIYMDVYGFISMICFDWVFTCRARVIHVSHAMFTFPLSCHVNIYLSYLLHASCLSC